MARKTLSPQVRRDCRVYFGIALLLLTGPAVANGQPAAGQVAGGAFSAHTDAETAFAKEIAGQPIDQAQKAIALADAARMTDGLYRALREIGEKVLLTDPRRTVAICEEAEAVATRAGQPILAADAHSAKAATMSAAGEIYEAIGVFDQAKEMYQAANAPPKKVVGVQLARAIANLHLGELQAAIDDDNEALRIARQLGDDVAVARAENGLGNAYEAEGSFSESEAAFTEALRLARAKGEKLGEGFVLNNLSTVYAAQGDFPLAARYGEQSLAIKRQVGNKANVATSLINLANAYSQAGREADANRVLIEAAQIGQELGNKEVSAKAIGEQGIIQLEGHHPEAALKLLFEGIAFGDGVEDQKNHVISLNKIAEAYLSLKDYPNALKYSQDAAAICHRSGLEDELSTSTLVQGQTYFELGKLKEARDVLKESIAAVEQMRNHVAGGAAARQLFMVQRTDPYRLLAAVEALLGEWPEALDASEKGKGRILLDLYTDSGLSGSVSLTDAERVEEARLRSRYVSLDMQSSMRSDRATADAAQKPAQDVTLQKAKDDLERYREALFSRHPDLRLRRAEFSQVSLRDLQRLVPDSSSALLEYEMTEVGDYLFIVTRGPSDEAAVRGYKLDVSKEELTRHIHHFREQMASRDPEFGPEARWLYDRLLRPARLQLKGKNSLVVVPDGVLWQTPFQALQPADEHFLVESAAVDYVPSLAVLQALKSSDRRPNRAAMRLLAMGNPGEATPEQAEEALTLGRLYGPKNEQTFLGKTATLGQFRKNAPDFDVVHVAAHGVFNDREPMSSHMLLAAEGEDPQAGWLRAREIQAMQLHAELVVLSGCETGKGSFEDGEGLVGMSWAALAAGAQGSLASAWRVEASSTTEIMLAFHRNMLSGVHKAEALRKAQLNLIGTEHYRHPFYWAAFELIGDGTR